MVYISRNCFYALNVFAVFATFVNLVISIEDYALPQPYDNIYKDYFNRNNSHFAQKKLNPKEFYEFVYNPYYLRVPELHHNKYIGYSERFNEFVTQYSYTGKEMLTDFSFTTTKSTVNSMIYDGEQTYCKTSIPFYEFNINLEHIDMYTQSMRILFSFSYEDYARDLLYTIRREVNKDIDERSGADTSTLKCKGGIFNWKRMRTGSKRRSTLTERSSEDNIKLEVDYTDVISRSSNSGHEKYIGILNEEEHTTLSALLNLLPPKDADESLYSKAYTNMLFFLININPLYRDEEIRRNIDDIEPLRKSRVRNLKSRYLLKSERSYNFYMVRSRFYDFVPYSLKFCQEKFETFKDTRKEHIANIYELL